MFRKRKKSSNVPNKGKRERMEEEIEGSSVENINWDTKVNSSNSLEENSEKNNGNDVSPDQSESLNAARKRIQNRGKNKPTQPQKSRQSKSKITSLSFGTEYEQGNEDILNFKKNSYDPSALKPASELNVASTHRSATGEYSTANLEKLRQGQKYSISHTSENDIEAANLETTEALREELLSEDIEGEDYIPLNHPQKRKEGDKSVTFAEALEEIREFDKVEALHKEEDNDLEAWEMEQIKRGSHLGSQISTLKKSMVSETISLEDILNAKPQDIPSIESIILKFEGYLNQAKEDHESIQRQEVRIQSHLEMIDTEIIELNEKSEKQDKKHNFFQEIRRYINDLSHCMREKIPMIEKVEKAVIQRQQDIYEHRMKKLNQYLYDELMELLETQQLIEIDQEDWSVLINKDQKKQDYDLEYNKKKQAIERKADREERKKHLRLKHTKENEEISFNCQNQQDGYDSNISSSEEEEEEELRRKKMIEASAIIFEDVEEEFHNLSIIIEKFHSWNQNYPEIYEEAFINLSLIKLLNPFIRYELLHWLPLKETREFDNIPECQWIEKLTYEKDFFGNEIIVHIIEEIILSKIKTYLQFLFPSSTSQNIHLRQILLQIQSMYPSIKDLSEIFSSCVVDQYHLFFSCLIIPKIHIHSQLTQGLQLFQRQWWKSIHYIHNLLLWEDIVSSTTLKETCVQWLSTKNLYFLDYYVEKCIQEKQLHFHSQHIIQMSTSLLTVIPSTWWPSNTYTQIQQIMENICRGLIQENINQHTFSFDVTNSIKKFGLLLKEQFQITLVYELLHHFE